MKWWLVIAAAVILLSLLFYKDVGADRGGKFNQQLSGVREGFENRNRYLRLKDHD